MSSQRVLVVSDTHLSDRAPTAAESWAAVAALAERDQPELVVHLGDLTLDGANDPAELEAGRAALDRLGLPWLALPGNHDIGDNPHPKTPEAWTVSQDRLDAWHSSVGPDRVAASIGAIRLVGIDAMLPGSGLAAEAEQWDWLHAELAAVPAGTPVVLASHKPLEVPPGDLAAATTPRYAPPAARARVASAASGVTLALVLSGHVHQHLRFEHRGRVHAWAPTTWAVLPDTAQKVIGTKRCGVLELAVDGTSVSTRVIEPEGLPQHTIGVDIPDPYRH